MGDELIAVGDIALEHRKHRQTVFKVLTRLGIETTKQRSSSSRGQLVSYITQDDYRRLQAEFLLINSRADSEDIEEEEAEDFTSAEEGVFYLIQLEPRLDPGRFKVGFASSLPERLRQLRCSAPFAAVLKTWPCRRLWEKTAIDCVSAGCERLHTEIFRSASLDEVSGRCDGFFAIMPSPQEAEPDLELQQAQPIAETAN
jgi:hypothetical protein